MPPLDGGAGIELTWNYPHEPQPLLRYVEESHRRRSPMFGKHMLTRLVLSVAALVVLVPVAPASDWFWYPQALFYRPWDWPISHWPSNYLFFTGTGYYGYYSVHYPMGGENSYIVTPADIKWIR